MVKRVFMTIVAGLLLARSGVTGGESTWIGDRYDDVDVSGLGRSGLFYWVGEGAPSETWLLACFEDSWGKLVWGMLRRQSDGATFLLQWRKSLARQVEIKPLEPFALVSPWWLGEEYRMGESEDGTAGAAQMAVGEYESVDEKGMPERIRISSPLLGESLIELRLFAKQDKKSGTDYIPFEMQPGAIEWQNAFPLRFTRRRIAFTDQHYRQLEKLIRDYERGILMATVQSVRQQLAIEEERLYNDREYTTEVLMCLYEVSPRAVTLLTFDMHQSGYKNTSARVAAVGFVYGKGGWRMLESLQPPNYRQLTPVRLNAESTALESPDLQPTTWLPGNIGLWDPYLQDAGAFGIVIARYEDRKGQSSGPAEAEPSAAQDTPEDK